MCIEIQLSEDYDKEYLILKGKEITWYRPTRLKDILMLKQQYPNAKIIVGNTEVGEYLITIIYIIFFIFSMKT